MNILKPFLLSFMSTVLLLSASGKKEIKRNPMKEDYHLLELSLYISLLDHPLIQHQIFNGVRGQH